MKSHFPLAAAVCVLFLHHCFGSMENDSLDPQENVVTIVSFDQGNFVANVTYDPQTENVTIQLEVNTTGYVSVGFAEKAPDRMKNYDVVVGGVKDNVPYLNVSIGLNASASDG